MQTVLGIDVGKTNIRAAVFDSELSLLSRWSTPSSDVPAACDALLAHLRALVQEHDVFAVGISTFGPLQTDSIAENYGAIPESSDATWSGVNLPALVASTVTKPVFFDYDVNAGALAEHTKGAARALSSFVYLSVGTGVGGVAFHGELHPGYAPQIGHIYLQREADDLNFPGSCRFHGACLQGLASGRAVSTRWGTPSEHLPPDHPAWDLEARYLATACANLIYSFSPKRIVLGSSLGLVPDLVERTNKYLPKRLNGFLEPDLSSLYARQPPVVRAALTPDSSLVGAAIMAKKRFGLPFPGKQ